MGGATGSIPHGGLLVSYAEAANRDPAAARALDDEVIAAVGEDGLVDAAVTVAVFNGLVRSADGARATLGFDGYLGAANSTR